MGWSGGASLFDPMVDLALSLVREHQGHVTVADTQEIVARVYEIFEHTDWDDETESGYFIPYLLVVLRDKGRVDDEYWESMQGYV